MHRGRHFLLLTIGGLLFPNILGAQISFTGDLTTGLGESKNNYNFYETRINTYLFSGPVLAWMQFEFSNPPELGRNVQGLRKFNIEYTTQDFSLKGGDIYELWGRGLVLNQFDDQAIDLDNGSRGFSFSVTRDLFTANIISGSADIWKQSAEVTGFSDYKPNYVTHHRVIGFNSDFSSTRNLSAGFSFLQSRENHPMGFFMDDSVALIHRLHGGRFSYANSIVDLYLEYVDKRTLKHDLRQSLQSKNNRGEAFYGNVNVYMGAWSINAEYKNYAFYRINPFDRGRFVANYGGMLDIQNPPTLIREHTSALMSRITHQVDFNSERGFQFEVTGPVTDHLNILLNYAQSSDQYLWEITGYDMTGIVWNKKNPQSFLPFSDLAALPFHEMYGEIAGYGFNYRLHYRLGIGQSSEALEFVNNFVTDSTQNLQSEIQEAVTIPSEVTYSFANGFSIEIKAEYQRLKKGFERHFYVEGVDTLSKTFASVFRDEDSQEKNYQYGHYFSFGIGKSPNWSLALMIDGVSVRESEPSLNVENYLEKFIGQFLDLENRWVGLELVLNISSQNRLTLYYGSQRGGLVCSNGVCRYIKPFNDGFKLSLTSVF